MPDRCGPRWGVYMTCPEDANDEQKCLSDYPIAAFCSTKGAWTWIDLKREQYFCECKSMEEAERKWGRHRFTVERTAVYSRKDTAKYCFNSFDEWPK